MKPNDRVKTEEDFLSDGVILKVFEDIGMAVVKLDEKAPNEYAYETDEVLLFMDTLTPALQVD